MSDDMKLFLKVVYVVVFLWAMFYFLGWEVVLKLFTDPQSI